MNLFKIKKLLKNGNMKTRFKVQKQTTYKIYDSENNTFWQICFNDWNTDNYEIARDHCDFMNQLHQNAKLEDARYRNYLRKKHG